MDDLVFARTGKGEKVHVLNLDPETREPQFFKTIESDEHRRAYAFVLGYIGTTLCGQDIKLATGGGAVWIFEDDELCARCHELFPGDQDLLFWHPVEVGS